MLGEQHGAVGKGGDVVDAGEQAGVFGRQGVGAGAGVVLEDAAGYHGPQPLAHVPFLQAGALGKLLAGGRALGRGFKEAQIVADLQHHVEHTAVVDARQRTSKGA